MAELNFEADIRIDKNRLDEELVEQALKQQRYGAAHAQAQLDRDRAKLHRDVIQSELDKQARENWQTLGIPAPKGSPSETAILNWVVTQPEYQKAQGLRQDAEYRVNLFFSAVMAMNARRQTLEDLVKLYLSGYWSEPRVQGAQEMKAQATQNATEAAIMRSRELGKEIPPPAPPEAAPAPPAPSSLAPASAPIPAQKKRNPAEIPSKWGTVNLDSTKEYPKSGEIEESLGFLSGPFEQILEAQNSAEEVGANAIVKLDEGGKMYIFLCKIEEKWLAWPPGAVPVKKPAPTPPPAPTEAAKAPLPIPRRPTPKQ